MFGSHEVPTELRRRVVYISVAASAALLLLLLRLWWLQILHGEDLAALSENNRIRLRRITATRGRIVDRYGRVLVESQASYDAVLVPEDAPDLENTVEILANFLNQSAAETTAVLQRAAGRPRFQEIIVKRNLEFETEVIAIETHQTELPGVSVRVTPKRDYRQGATLAHVLGYIGEVSREDLERSDRYRGGDLIGKSGLEMVFDEQLRGVNGGRHVEVDALGREIRVLDKVEALAGNTLVLSVDLDLQRSAEQALGDQVGAVVVLDPSNGDLLAMASMPSYDPNMFNGGIKREDWKALMEDRHKPMTQRAFRGQYPPGSTFKMIVAAAALQEGVINPFTTISCRGAHRLGSRDFRCWRNGGHGAMTVTQALIQSCDVFFYQVGQKLGVDLIAKYARAFGLGAPTGIVLGSEKGGVIPDREWKREKMGEPWYPGETLPVAIGQGYVTATPLQMAHAVGALAVGKRYRPRLVLRLEGQGGEVVETIPEHLAGDLDLKPGVLEEVRQGLVEVVNNPRGTGKNAALPGVVVAGKTGTSQVVTIGAKRIKPEDMPWEQRDHAWFVAFAPAADPEVALAVLVEHASGGGGKVAAPIARAVMEDFFRLKQQRGPVRYAEN
jgi:penicillin-binding protein 2